MTDICQMGASELVARYRNRELSPVEATRAALDRIAALDGTYNAFCVLDAARALADAEASEARWAKGEPLGLVDGVPTTVKDLILAKGWPTLRGSRAIDPDQAWDEDGPPVARLRAHGAVLLGKTCTPEFGWKGVTDSPLTGVTRNPWDAKLTPGGSSGGAAAACALGMGAIHIATDGGGSIRIPAGFCGLFGIKPTFGIVPVHPHSPAGTLWHQGPISRSVADAGLVLTVISEADARDWYALPPRGIDYRQGLDDGIRGLRIAYSPTLGNAKVDAEVAEVAARAVQGFADLGAEITEVAQVFDDPLPTMIELWSVALALGIDGMPEAKRALMEPPILEIAAGGEALGAVAYRKAERAREALGQRMARFHADYDLLVTPQLPLTAFEAGVEVPPGRGMTRWWEWSPFTYPFNLTQQPAATLPCGLAANGLPVAMQVVGRKFDEATVLRACRAFEAAHPFSLPPQP
jgi:aspartyl-tRNA(Asn)/glutamyl-tRNA(Gln) amidotransferase subunit A